MVPAAIIGLFFDEILESLFEGQLKLVGAMLFITGGLLILADRAKNTNKKVGVFSINMRLSLLFLK